MVVVLRPTSGTIGDGDSVRDYDRDPSEGCGDSDLVGIANRDFADDRRRGKALVIGGTLDGVARASARSGSSRKASWPRR